MLITEGMILDLIVATVILVSAAISFFRGLIREIFTIAGVVGGSLASIFFAPPLAKIFRGWFGVFEGETPEKLFDLIPMNFVADGCAYAAVFIAFVIIISVFSQFFSAAVKAAGLGPVDRSLGVVFGIVRAVLLLALVYLPFHLLMEEQAKAQYFADSKSHLYLEKTSSWIAGFLPSSEEVEAKIDHVKDNQIREKLLQNEILPDKTNTTKEPEKSAPQKQENPETGYKDSTRDQMDTLFDDAAGGSKAGTLDLNE